MLTALHSWAQRGNRFVRLVLALPCIVIALCSTTLIVLRDVDKAVVETSHSSIGFTRRRDATWTRDINSAIERAWPHPRRLRENGGQSSVEGVEIHPMQVGNATVTSVGRLRAVGIANSRSRSRITPCSKRERYDMICSYGRNREQSIHPSHK